MANSKEQPNLISLFNLHFNEIDEKEIQEIIDACEEVALTFGEYLFKQGDPSDSLYILLSGRLRLYKRMKMNLQLFWEILVRENQ
jgi:CRP-like cAMP-binding protein